LGLIWINAYAASHVVAFNVRSNQEPPMSRMQTAPSSPGLLDRVLDWVRNHSAPGEDLAALSRDELRHIAGDLSLADSDLIALSARGRDNTRLMTGMIRACGLDPDQLRHSFGTLLRDIERVCSRCRFAGRCRRELEAGSAPVHFRGYCPNAGTFDDLIICKEELEGTAHGETGQPGSTGAPG
jgi:hypothetical protein